MIFLGTFLQTPRVDHTSISLSKQTATNLAQGCIFYFAIGKKGEERHADEEEAPFLC